MIINALLSNIARTTGPNVRLPDGTLSRNINYYLPLLEAAASGSGDVYAGILETYEVWTDSPPATLPTTPVEALALMGVMRSQIEIGTTQLNLFGNANSGTPGTDTTLYQAIKTQLDILADYLIGPTELFAVTTTALGIANGSTLTVSNVKDTRSSVVTIRDAIDVNLTAWNTYSGTWNLATPGNLTLATTSLGLAASATIAVIADVNDAATISTGGAPASDTTGAQTSLSNISNLLTDILAYVNANPGTAISASGAPFASLQAWATAQGI